jgi:hypothetical protein
MLLHTILLVLWAVRREFELDKQVVLHVNFVNSIERKFNVCKKIINASIDKILYESR